MRRGMRYGTPMMALMLNGVLLTPASAVTVMNDVTMSINMTIADVTCQVNSGAGLSQQVNMPLMSLVDLQANRGPMVEAPLTVDCTGSPSQPSSITLSVEPTGGSSLLGSGDLGQLKTNQSGIGLKLTWKHDGLPLSLTSATPRVFIPSMAVGNVWDLGIMAQTIAVPGETAKGGEYVGAIRLNLRYS
ncbi:hypothetical protein [Hafnia sp.]|uniref:hypothetical protein n=1 Tax=Hafnia sp. TaxID=1873498 RepID=UPI002FC96EA1